MEDYSLRHGLLIAVTLFVIGLLVACSLFGASYILVVGVNEAGAGNVNIDPPKEKHKKGDIVELTAVANYGWEFSHWEGDLTGTNANVKVTMDKDKNITAVFVRVGFSLNIIIEGQGDVDIEEIFTPASYPYETILELTAIPETNWIFSNWDGDFEGTEEIIEVTMDKDKTITAKFISNTVSGNINIVHNWPTSVIEEASLSQKPLLASKGEKAKDFNFEDYRPGQIIIKFYPVTAQEEKISTFQALNVEVIDRIEYLNAYLVATSGADIYSDISAAQALPGVAYAEPNYVAKALTTTPNDTFYSHQWHYPQIRLPQAWNITTGADWVRIAVLDTGVDVGHPDLGGNVDVAAGYNFVDEEGEEPTDFNDWNNHGTHVAGTIGADTDNNLGVAGVMWECSIIPVKVLDDNGSGEYWWIAQGILYSAGLLEDPAISSPAHVINMSLGGSGYNQTLEEAVQSAADAGVILVGATGNDDSSILYPALFHEVIAVGAVDLNYPHAPGRAPYSNYGPEIDLVAPGGDTSADTNENGFPDGVLSTAFDYEEEEKDYDYRFFQGTSMAAPHVSGVIGLMLSAGISAEDVREILHRTSMDIGSPGFNEEFGHGLINAYWAVNDVQKIKILIGNRDGNTIDAVMEKEINLRDATFEVNGIPAGEYRVYAWIDVLGNGEIDPGDYLVESDEILFSEEETHSVDLVLEEYK